MRSWRFGGLDIVMSERIHQQEAISSCSHRNKGSSWCLADTRSSCNQNIWSLTLRPIFAHCCSSIPGPVLKFQLPGSFLMRCRLSLLPQRIFKIRFFMKEGRIILIFLWLWVVPVVLHREVVTYEYLYETVCLYVCNVLVRLCSRTGNGTKNVQASVPFRCVRLT